MTTVVLLSTYELGRQPFGLASPTAWLRAAGAEVVCVDLAVESLPVATIERADLVAFYLPMHTATRLAATQIAAVQQINPRAQLACYGLYAPVNQAYLTSLGVQTILGGEFEAGLVAWFQRLTAAQPQKVQTEPVIALERQRFQVPVRSGLPALERYAQLHIGSQQRLVGYTEASRGCKHRCRHCPIVPVYNGQFRVVQPDVVLEDIRQQVAAGAQHITFGDPDFFNSPSHAVALVQALHAAFPALTYDVTIKVEHLLKQRQHLPVLRETGCLFVISAVEAIDDAILERLDKRRTRNDFVAAAHLLRQTGLVLNPTFVTFTPWTTLAGYCQLLALLAELDLVEQVAPIQYAIRLLIPAGSRLLELAEVQELVGQFDQQALCYPWQHPDPAVDQLFADVLETVKRGQRQQMSRPELFAMIWDVAHRAAGLRVEPAMFVPSQRLIPWLSEPWYC